MSEKPQCKSYSVQILRHLPAAYFKPVGRSFIVSINAKFNVQPPLDEDTFGRYCFAYFLYCDIGGCHNISHPGFLRTAQPELQVIVCLSIWLSKWQIFLRSGLWTVSFVFRAGRPFWPTLT